MTVTKAFRLCLLPMSSTARSTTLHVWEHQAGAIGLRKPDYGKATAPGCEAALGGFVAFRRARSLATCVAQPRAAPGPGCRRPNPRHRESAARGVIGATRQHPPNSGGGSPNGDVRLAISVEINGHRDVTGLAPLDGTNPRLPPREPPGDRVRLGPGREPARGGSALPSAVDLVLEKAPPAHEPRRTRVRNHRRRSFAQSH